LKLLTPAQTAENLHNIDLSALACARLLIIDIDNTIIPHGDSGASIEILNWLEEARHRGLKIVLMSNNSQKKFPFLDIYVDMYYCRSLKPLSVNYKKVMKKFKVSPSQTVMIGDQIFTDVLGANRLGIKTVLVRRQKNYGKFTRKILHKVEDKMWEKFI